MTDKPTGRRGPGSTLAIIAVYLLSVVVLGSITGYGLSLLFDFAYEKLLSRSVLLYAALGLVPLWRVFGLSSATIGIRPAGFPGPNFAGLQARLYLAGILALLPPMLFFVVVGFRVWDQTVTWYSSEFLTKCLIIFVSAWLVAVFEETLFRGVMFSALRRSMSFVATAGISSLLYAGVHFLEPTESTLLEPDWLSGIPVVLSAFAGLGGAGGSLDSFAGLFLLGVAFCWVRERLSLWSAIALHSAFVCGLRIFKELTIRDIVHPYAFLVGDYDHFVGLLIIFWLLFGFVVGALYVQHRKNLGFQTERLL